MNIVTTDNIDNFASRIKRDGLSGIYEKFVYGLHDIIEDGMFYNIAGKDGGIDGSNVEIYIATTIKKNSLPSKFKSDLYKASLHEPRIFRFFCITSDSSAIPKGLFAAYETCKERKSEEEISVNDETVKLDYSKIGFEVEIYNQEKVARYINNAFEKSDFAKRKLIINHLEEYNVEFQFIEFLNEIKRTCKNIRAELKKCNYEEFLKEHYLPPDCISYMGDFVFADTAREKVEFFYSNDFLPLCEESIELNEAILEIVDNEREVHERTLSQVQGMKSAIDVIMNAHSDSFCKGIYSSLFEKNEGIRWKK